MTMHESKIESLIQFLKIGDVIFFSTPSGQPDLHIEKLSHNNYKCYYSTMNSAYFSEIEEDDYSLPLTRSVHTDILSDYSQIISGIDRIVKHINSIMTSKMCKLCNTAFSGFSTEPKVCPTCYLKCKHFLVPQEDAICMVCHEEGTELFNKMVMKTKCCKKFICLTCRTSLRSQIVDDKYTVICPQCRECLPTMTDDNIKAFFGSLNFVS